MAHGLAGKERLGQCECALGSLELENSETELIEGHVQLGLESPPWSTGKLKLGARVHRTAQRLREKQISQGRLTLHPCAIQETPPCFVLTGPVVL